MVILATVMNLVCIVQVLTVEIGISPRMQRVSVVSMLGFCWCLMIPEIQC